MKLYKLTDQKMRTHKGLRWELGRWYEMNGEDDSGWLYFYTNPLLAVLLNPIHADFKNPKLFEAEGEIGKRNYNIRVGCKCGRIVKEIKLPKITTAQRVRWAILCSLEVYDQPEYRRWAANWLSGEDRTTTAAEAALTAAAAEAALTAAAEAAAKAAAWMARAAKVEAEAAARAAKAAEAAVKAAEAAAWAGWAAKAEAAEAAAEAAEAVAWAGARIPLVKLAEQAIRDEVV